MTAPGTIAVAVSPRSAMLISRWIETQSAGAVHRDLAGSFIPADEYDLAPLIRQLRKVGQRRYAVYRASVTIRLVRDDAAWLARQSQASIFLAYQRAQLPPAVWRLASACRAALSAKKGRSRLSGSGLLARTSVAMDDRHRKRLLARERQEAELRTCIKQTLAKYHHANQLDDL